MNNVVLVGRLSQEPLIKETSSGRKYVSSQIAVNDRLKETTYFIPFTAWGKNADVIERYCQKGDMIGITGKLVTIITEDENGKSRKNVFVEVENVELMMTRPISKENNIEEDIEEEIEVDDKFWEIKDEDDDLDDEIDKLLNEEEEE
ncbi:MAG: single-stranded DNA-binding protein [Thermovenabulum sp.]|uniref:single-stranded DNA-binding protein n=1 Tax=Thermovenabulum sp. TaxID=3100335 RepID=UPI003C7CE0E6